MRFHHLNQNAPGWTTLEETVAFANPFAQVRVEKIATPTRPEGALWTVVHRKGACVVAPLLADGRLLLIRQERLPIRATIWEFPAGQIDEVPESPDGTHAAGTIRATALRELQEETGHELAPGGELLPLGLFYSSPGIMDEHNHLFVARPVIPTAAGARPESTEAIAECRAFTPAAFREMIAAGEICDANTLAAFARMTARGIL